MNSNDILDPPMDAIYDQIADEYDQRYQGPFWDVYDHVTMDLARDVLPAKGHILDAGAGTGKHALKWLRSGHRVTLLDPSSKMLDVARHRIQTHLSSADAEYMVGGIQDLLFPDDHFDGVFSEGDPLSYCIDTREDAARELLRVLRPGGTFYVSCDNRWIATLGLAARGHIQDAFNAADEGVSRDPYGTRVHAFDPDELHGLFTNAGATGVQVTGKIHITHLLHPDTLQAIADNELHRKKWYALEAALSRKPSMSGLATHLTVTGHKPQGGGHGI